MSTVSALVLLGPYIWAVIQLWPPQSSTQALATGAIWLLLTIAFEFLFGRYVARHSWSRLFHDYNIFAGRVWLLVPAWVAIAPYVFHRLQHA